jgi:Alginate export
MGVAWPEHFALPLRRWMAASIIAACCHLHPVLFGTAYAQSAQPSPPPLTPTRYNEDYSYLADPDARSGAWWEPLKYISLNEAGDIYLTLGGEARLRYEGYNNNNWGQEPAPDDGYLWYRVMPTVDLHLGPNVRLFGELIGAWVDGKQPSPSPIDRTGLDFLQGFADLTVPLNAEGTSLTIRPGRQLLSYGTERLIGTRYGPNVMQTFDSIKGFVDGDGWRVDSFYAQAVEPLPDDFDDKSHDDLSIWSLYGTVDLPIGDASGLDLYYIGFNNDLAVYNQGTGAEERHTVGARLFGRAEGWDWDWEAMYQFGEFGDGDISAWSVASNTGYTFEDVLFSPRLGLKANIISGDDDPDDEDLQTFNPLFPKGKYFGELTLLSPRNLINLHSTVDLQLGDRWSLGGSAVLYWRESTGDGIYDFGGNLIRDDGGSDERYIGTQGEVVLTYEVNRNLNAMLSYSRFYPGAFVEDTGPGKIVDFVGAELNVQF